MICVCEVVFATMKIQIGRGKSIDWTSHFKDATCPKFVDITFGNITKTANTVISCSTSPTPSIVEMLLKKVGSAVSLHLHKSASNIFETHTHIHSYFCAHETTLRRGLPTFEIHHDRTLDYVNKVWLDCLERAISADLIANQLLLDQAQMNNELRIGHTSRCLLPRFEPKCNVRSALLC